MTFSPTTLAPEVNICCWDCWVNWKCSLIFFCRNTDSSKGMKSSQHHQFYIFWSYSSNVCNFRTHSPLVLEIHEIPPHPFLFQASSSQGHPATFCSEPSRHELQRRCELTGWHLLIGSCEMEVAMISTKSCLWIGKHGYFAKESDRFKFQ